MAKLTVYVKERNRSSDGGEDYWGHVWLAYDKIHRPEDRVYGAGFCFEDGKLSASIQGEGRERADQLIAFLRKNRTVGIIREEGHAYVGLLRLKLGDPRIVSYVYPITELEEGKFRRATDLLNVSSLEVRRISGSDVRSRHWGWYSLMLRRCPIDNNCVSWAVRVIKRMTGDSLPIEGVTYMFNLFSKKRKRSEDE